MIDRLKTKLDNYLSELYDDPYHVPHSIIIEDKGQYYQYFPKCSLWFRVMATIQKWIC